MKNIKTRKKNRKLFFRFILFIFIVWVLWSIVSLQFDLAQRRREYAQIQSQLEEKNITNAELKDLIENGGDEKYKIKIARERLGYVYPDEIVFVDYSGK